ncbi:uncharacterized protein [Ovis canadensis]|uniref:uncharacterized protein n=1 Tax=Ovis canadensis TaxID=37174 RepID=UPI0037529C2F
MLPLSGFSDLKQKPTGNHLAYYTCSLLFEFCRELVLNSSVVRDPSQGFRVSSKCWPWIGRRLLGTPASDWLSRGRPPGAKAGDKGVSPGEEAAARLPQLWTVHEAGARSPSPGSLGDRGLPSCVNQCGLIRVMKGYCPRDRAEFPTTTHAKLLHEAHQPAHHPQHRIPGLGTGQRETWEPERTDPNMQELITEYVEFSGEAITGETTPHCKTIPIS